MTDPTDRDKLDPCPFCGGEGKLCFDSEELDFLVTCTLCAASVGGDGTGTKASAIAGWNRRPTPQAGDELAGELADLIESRLLGVHPDDQDLQLEDKDWRAIIVALRSGNQCLQRLCDEHGAIEVWPMGEGLGWRPLNTHEPCQILTALTASGNDVLREALAELAEAEKAYRFTHDTQGDGSRLTGRAWDLMRRAGDKAREYLAALSNEGTEG